MSQTLLVALLATLPLSAVAFLCALGVEALGAGLKARLRAWMLALVLPLLIVPATLGVQAMGISSPLALSSLTAPAPVVQQAVLVAATPIEASPQLPWIAIILATLAIGAAVRLLGMAIALYRLSGLVTRSAPIDDPELAARLGGGPEIRQGDHDTPMLAGLRRPVILLPRKLLTTLTPDQTALVCAHERAHLAARDHLSHLMEETMTRLFWFNPLVSVIRDRLSAAREEACDARALAAADDAGRRTYARTLLAALRLSGEAVPAAAFTGFRRKGADRRFRAILKPAGASSPLALAWAGVAGLGLAVATGGAALALAASPEPQSPKSIPAAPKVAPAPDSFVPVPGPTQRRYMVRRQAAPAGSPEQDRQDRFELIPAPGDDVVFFSGRLTPEQAARMKEAEQKFAEAGERFADVDRRARVIERRRLTGEDRPIPLPPGADKGDFMSFSFAMPAPKPDAEGRVLMRCKPKADGGGEDCQRVAAGPMPFTMPLPPLPPEAPRPAPRPRSAPPAPPAPPPAPPAPPRS